MNKLGRTVIFSIIVWLITTAISFGATGAVNVTSVNMRKAPNTSAEVVKTLNLNEVIDILRE